MGSLIKRFQSEFDHSLMLCLDLQRRCQNGGKLDFLELSGILVLFLEDSFFNDVSCYAKKGVQVYYLPLSFSVRILTCAAVEGR